MDENFSFGYWLKRQRLARDLQQSELAAQLGIATVTLRKIEADERRPSLQLIARLAEVLALDEEQRATLQRVARADLSAAALVLPTAAHSSLLRTAAPADAGPTRAADTPARPVQVAGTLPSGAVTFLFTDIASSTWLWEQQPEAMREALARHNALLYQATTDHGGIVVKGTGDGLLAAFADAAAALSAALAGQRALLAERWPLNEPLRSRMALHTGQVAPTDGDYVGPSLNRVARLLAAGHGGQILVSQVTSALLRETLPAQVQLRELGTYRLKDLSRPEAIFQVEAADLPGEFPPLRISDTRPHNLPPQSTPFIGRLAELAALDTHFADAGLRLVSITGHGGMGKTRLALAAAEHQLATGRFPDGAFFVALAPVDTAEQIVTTLAAALDLPLASGGPQVRTPRQQALDYLRAKRLLLILDNCEHLLDGVRALATAILGEAPAVRLLATSRERLNLRGEQLFPLGGLSAGEEADAVALFAASASRLRPDFAVDADHLAAVVRICTLVGGMPLAIELAASWIDTLTLDEIAAEIAGDLGVLESESYDMPARHRSMRAVFDATWQRLDPAEREVLARLAVFRGGCTRQAVQAIAGASLRQLNAFVGKSLLQHHPERDRYAIHELLREYAAERLAVDPQQERAARERHAAYYLRALAEHAADLKGARQREALEAIEADGDNARAAWEWAAHQQHVALLDQASESLGHFYEWQGRAEEGLAAFRAAAEALDGSSALDARRVRAQLLAWQSAYTLMLGDHVSAEALLAQGQQLLDGADLADVDTRAERAFVLLQAGLLATDRNHAAARAAYERSRALFEETGDQWGEAAALSGLGYVCLNLLGDYDLAQQCLEQSLALRRALDDRLGIVETLTHLSVTARYVGRVAESERLARESYDLAHTMGNRQAIARAASNLGIALNWSGNAAEAQRLLQEAVTIYTDLGDRLNLANAYARLGNSEADLGRYADARGTLERALALARGVGSVTDVGFCLVELATVALAEGDYTEARSLAAEAIPLLTAVGERFFLSGMLIQSALAERGLGKGREARQQTVAALHIALENRIWGTARELLRTAALLLADEEELERAVELDALVEREGLDSNTPWAAALWGRELAAVAAGLPADAAAAAQARGQARDLWATVGELLADLEARGWGAGEADM